MPCSLHVARAVARARRRPLWCCECSALQVPCSTSRDAHRQRTPCGAVGVRDGSAARAALDGGSRARRRPLWCCECSALQAPCSTSRDTHRQRIPCGAVGLRDGSAALPRSMAACAQEGGRSGAVSAVPCRRPAAQAVTRTGSGSLAAQLASATAVLRCRARWRLARRKAAAWCGNSRGPHCLGRSAAPPQPRFQLSAFRRANDGSHILYFCRADAPYRHRTAA